MRLYYEIEQTDDRWNVSRLNLDTDEATMVGVVEATPKGKCPWAWKTLRSDWWPTSDPTSGVGQIVRIDVQSNLSG